jgi:hypothetical protein
VGIQSPSIQIGALVDDDGSRQPEALVLSDVFRQLFSLLLILLPLRQYHAEWLCNLWMQLAWKVTLRNDESSKGSEP